MPHLSQTIHMSILIVHTVHNYSPYSPQQFIMKIHKVYNNIYHKLYHKPSLPPSLTLTLVTKSVGAWSVRVRWTASPSA